MRYYLSPSGDDINAGDSSDRPWKTIGRLNRHLLEGVQPGDVFSLEAGSILAGSIQVRMPVPGLTFDIYDGDGFAVINSMGMNGFDYAGGDGLTVRGLWFRGSGRSEEYLHAGVNVSARARSLAFERVRADGYAFAGMLMMGDLDGVTVQRSYFVRNANGFFVSGPKIRGLNLFGTEASENDLYHPASSGWGMSINGAEEVTISGCRASLNGRHAMLGGQSGLMLYLCHGATIRHTEASDNTDPSRTGDGQGIVIDDCQDVLVECCQAHRNLHGGIQIHDEFQDTSPSNVTVRGCSLINNVVGISHQGGLGNTVWDGNYVRSDIPGQYRTAVDIHMPGPGTRFFRNVIESFGGSHCLVAETGLRGCTFAGDSWDSDSAEPSFVVRGLPYSKLSAALAAESVLMTRRQTDKHRVKRHVTRLQLIRQAARARTK